MGIALGLLLLFGLVLTAAPIVLSTLGINILGAAAFGIMLISGILLVVTCAVLFTITKLYVKTKASEAFVRTGMGGLKVIKDGGAIVLPIIHQIVKVSLETIRLEVQRTSEQSLITEDKLRADIRAEFFVRVQPEDNSIQAAARSLGDKMTTNAVSSLIEDKLVSALRTAAARKTLEQLNSERDEFLREVMKLVADDLSHNGFTLESVTISALDQTDTRNLKENNIFDAQGMRTIAEITQKNLTDKNKIERENEQLRAAQDVETRKRILDLEQERLTAEAEQSARVQVIQADQDRVTKEKQIEAARLVDVADVEKTKKIEIAKREQQREIEIAERNKHKAIVLAEQEVEVAKRAQQEAIAKAEAQKAREEALLAEAETEKTKAQQAVITTEQIAEADREKQKSIIAASAEAEKGYVTEQKKADANAYKVKAEADARKASADAEAEAIKKRAAADAEAKELAAQAEKTVLISQAEGERAKAMVPVDVKAREVEVDKTRVEAVLKRELEARAEHGKAAQDFELAKLQIEANKEVKIESAKAMVSVYGKITANVFGTPEDVAKMSQSFASGLGLANNIEGFVDGTGEETMATIKKALAGIEKFSTSVSNKLLDKPDEMPAPIKTIKSEKVQDNGITE